jgi:transposase
LKPITDIATLTVVGESFKQTGGKPPVTGPISKQGNAYARFMLIEAAEHFKNSPPIYRKLYDRIKKKKGHNKAIVAVAGR